MITRTFFFVFLLIAGTTNAQLPNTDLYLLNMVNNGKSYSAKSPVFLSGFNPDGYNNQPHFLDATNIVITSNHYDKAFTDIIRLDLIQNEFYRVTATDSISEFSPNYSALDDDFCTVRIEKDQTTQSLFQYPKDHGGFGNRVLKEFDNIGYYKWLSEEEIVLFLVEGDRNRLVIYNSQTEEEKEISTNPGRAFDLFGDETLLFVEKLRPDLWYLKKYNLDNGRVEIMAQTRPGSEDFVVLKDKTVLMAEKSKIFALPTDATSSWYTVTDLSEFEIDNITRLAAFRNKLIIVDAR